MIKEENIQYNRHGQLLDLYLPVGRVKAVFVYFHGGGLEAGTRNACAGFASQLAENGVAVVSADYRLYPQAQYPEFIEDAADAVAWVIKNRSKFGNCDRVFVGGSSAGGYLSMMLCFDRGYLAKHNLKPTDLAGFIHDSGQPTSHFNVLREKGIDTRRVIVDETAPLYFVGMEESYPPMLFLVADEDMENRYEQTMLMLSTLKHFCYDTEKIKHKVLYGRHCAHVRTNDLNGNNIFGKLVLEFINERVERS